MSSNRPETSVPGASSEAATEKPLPIVGVKSYVPNIFDLVYPLHRARDTAKLFIPPAFLQSEAVDSSRKIGEGASFTVTRQAIPPGPAEVIARQEFSGWEVANPVKTPERPQYVVYKAARVSFQDDGDPATPDDRRALQSVLTEFYALLHPPLFDHPNIIDILGIAWGSNPSDPFHQLPVLVVEYGNRGTLADVQLGGPPLSDEVKHDLCLGVARGLQVLHENGINHGDLKPENIIMFSKHQKLVPKLADFGFAIIEATEANEVSIGGTRMWRAPESFDPVPASKIRLTDVYSFGLVAWSIAVNGTEPFDLIVGGLQGEDRFAEIKRIKTNDEVLILSKFERWLYNWNMMSRFDQLAKQSGGSPSDQARVRALLAQTTSNPSTIAKNPQLNSAVSRVNEEFRHKPLFRVLEALFENTLSKAPDRRSLDRVLQLLQGNIVVEITRTSNIPEPSSIVKVDAGETQAVDKDGQKYLISNRRAETAHFKVTVGRAKQPALPGTSSQSHRYSWQVTRDLEPSLQSFVVKTLFHRDDLHRHFVLCPFLLNGYGVPSDVDRGLDYFSKAATQGHYIAQAYLYRMYKACQKDIPAGVPILEYLKTQALYGSRMALEDLKLLDKNHAAKIRSALSNGYAGVATTWYNDSEWKYGLTRDMLWSKEFSLDALGSKDEIQHLVVNARGDRLLQAAAAIGATKVIEQLLPSVDVNQRNAKGETALLCACRSGHPDVVKLLLDNGARSLASTNGESPLHWLLSFAEDINCAALGTDLIERGGAKVDAFTTESISYSVFPGTIDVDFRPAGTPLMWAVHDNRPGLVSFYLSVGADPEWQLRKGNTTPLQWAAFYHHTDCLKALIAHCEETVDAPTTTDGKKDLRHTVFYGALVHRAVHAADKFSMILRNGTRYRQQLRSTLELLQEKTMKIHFNLGERETLLHFAAREAHDEACEIILELGWRNTLTDEINHPAGPREYTPLLESVRWNRPSLFHLLRRHGADPRVLAPSPYDESRTWSALHVFADQAHNEDLQLVDDLVAAGVPVEGDPAHSIETPLHIAVRRNAFRLADLLRKHGAAIDAVCTRSALLLSPHPLTALGHLVALNARHSFPGLRYILAAGAGFVVEPARSLSVLHLCALMPQGLAYVGGTPLTRDDFDWETNSAIALELRTGFPTPEHLNQRCQIGGRTALHLAAEYGNLGVTTELVHAGADTMIKCEQGETPADLARRVWKDQPMQTKLLALLQ